MGSNWPSLSHALQSPPTESSAGSMSPAEALARVAGQWRGLCFGGFGPTDQHLGAGSGVPAASAGSLPAPSPRGETRVDWKFVGLQKGWIQGSKGTHSMLPSWLVSKLGLGALGLKSTCLHPIVGYQPRSPEAQGRWDLDPGIALPARGTDQRYRSWPRG